MSTQNQSMPTFMSAIWPARDGAESRMMRALILVVAGSALLAISAHVAIPFYPVPMTLQTGVVLLIGLAYGWKLGFSTVLLYLAEGAVGLPVFTSGAGLAYMAGPTGGYLVGFAVAAVVAGYAFEQAPNVIGLVVGVVLAEIAIFALGVGWLATLIGFDAAIANGLAPFVYGDVLKTVTAVVLAIAGRRYVQAWLGRAGN